MSQDGLRQASARAIASTTNDYNGDLHAMFKAEATVPAGATYNGAFIAWLQERLGSADTCLPNLMQAFAEQESATNWTGLGSFDPGAALITEGLVAEWRFDEAAGQSVADYSGDSHDLCLGSGTGSDTNDPTWVTGGLSFDGSDNYVTTDNGGGDWTFPSPNFHVDIVVKGVTGGAGTDFLCVFGTTNAGAADDDLSPLILFRDATNAWIDARIGTGAANTNHVFDQIDLWDDGWHHLAIDYDGTDLTMILDGGAAEQTKTYTITPNSHSAATQFGIWHDKAQLPAKMILGYVAVYDTEFTEQQNTDQHAALTAIMAARGIDIEAPTVPANLAASVVSGTEVDLTWSASTDNFGVDHYNIYRDDALLDTSATTSYSDTGLSIATYEYEVSAVDAAGNESARSASDTVTDAELLAAHEAVISALSPTGWWKFDEGSGATLTNHGSVGSAGDGTLGATTAAPAWSSEGLSFDGSEDVVTFTSDLGIAGTDARTILGVVAPGDGGSSTTKFNIGWGPSAGTNGQRYWIRCANSTDDMRVEIQGEGFTHSSFNFDAGNWHLVGATHSAGGTQLAQSTLYMDGSTQAASGTSVTVNTALNFHLGFVTGLLTGPYEIAYLLVFDSVLSAGNLAAVRTALTAIMDARGITLP